MIDFDERQPLGCIATEEVTEEERELARAALRRLVPDEANEFIQMLGIDEKPDPDPEPARREAAAALMRELRRGPDTSWMERAACAGAPDPDAWFPEGQHAPTLAVVTFCEKCPVRIQCADYAAQSQPPVSGVWGGVRWSERRSYYSAPLPTKKCTGCKVVKPLEEFHRDSKQTDGRMSRCRVCRSEYHYKYRLRNQDRFRERKRLAQRRRAERLREQRRNTA